MSDSKGDILLHNNRAKFALYATVARMNRTKIIRNWLTFSLLKH